ncbi:MULTISPECIES: MotA/TolQ/ExbB proton channel family protein [Spongiibacter]|jgi:biopolymer transport protein ExbB|uniref:MotA/TolQ/ExbB proton channel family protein n=1 Tax=Spongiibacter TaxID=630749 RepID=UPI0004210F75|nr:MULTISPECIES: MotA/TolQ/ExbB proton channel family protein [Spongiibacter]MAK44454.1 MotA/TolQ/ExbB proton channel family protein [Spongiibacter sp.]MBM7421769.1 biopolymer transport protein ExbB [Spongiibacter marinus]MEE2651752.1 MotA/TolQ/ExbB proton channel family protein [Pseudomonadota bacterium]|tara:strand:+ start:20843 stop:21370 length:528 start_codon:yes stop_codon:yes gene_type:complete
MYQLNEWIEIIRRFMEAGGPVLNYIALLTFVMWTLAIERVWYYKFGLSKDVNNAINTWEARSERKSWNAKQIREKLISEVSLQINASLPMIQTMVALCPLLGLLGTVTGMIEVFNIMAVTGGGDAKSMAGGVSKATIPTMAGMVAALSGVFINTYIKGIAERESELLEDHLTTDH